VKSEVEAINNTRINAGIMILQNWQLPYAGLHGVIVSQVVNLQKVQNYYHISRPIKCTMIFLLDILEKIMMNVF
jgi:hypothetical protein